MADYFTEQMSRNILHTSIMNLKASADVKISTFWRKMWGWGCGSQNEPLIIAYPKEKVAGGFQNCEHRVNENATIRADW